MRAQFVYENLNFERGVLPIGTLQPGTLVINNKVDPARKPSTSVNDNDNEIYMFDKWEDSNWDNPRMIIIPIAYMSENKVKLRVPGAGGRYTAEITFPENYRMLTFKEKEAFEQTVQKSKGSKYFKNWVDKILKKSKKGILPYMLSAKTSN